MERVLKLPCNEGWYYGILYGLITFDYREIKPYWIKRLHDKEYDVVEFYHRFKKNLYSIRYKFLKIEVKHISGIDKDYYIIRFGDRIE